MTNTTQIPSARRSSGCAPTAADAGDETGRPGHRRCAERRRRRLVEPDPERRRACGGARATGEHLPARRGRGSAVRSRIQVNRRRPRAGAGRPRVSMDWPAEHCRRRSPRLRGFAQGRRTPGRGSVMANGRRRPRYRRVRPPPWTVADRKAESTTRRHGATSKSRPAGIARDGDGSRRRGRPDPPKLRCTWRASSDSPSLAKAAACARGPPLRASWMRWRSSSRPRQWGRVPGAVPWWRESDR